MTKARDIMHVGVECVGEHETLDNAARRMRDLDVGALPICGDDDRLKGILTDRDIVLKCVATGGNPADMTAGELAQGTPHTIDAESDVDQVLHLMEEHRVRRVPVLENRRLVGIIAEADLGRNLPEDRVGHFVETICADA
ncbi:CBS domain-containing protein [Actinopolymorpha sp. B11F2]|uniref:CBS domain-containing protein n=1 Tax=Actinopolymorpha sp. B11F2 TaxID=3160862 RepID=UPI0032E3A3EC